MSWRVVVATSRCKLEYKLGYLICRGEQTKKIFLDEISTLIIESTAVAITGVLLAELVKRKINVIFCDENHNPLSQLNGLYGRYDCSGKIKQQLEWKDDTKAAVWAEIVKEKLRQQALHLRDLGIDRAELIESYIPQVESGDVTNREGHAAKVYFNSLFGMDFTRTGDSGYNAVLNYGYSILLSAFSREVVGCGYITQCGIFHRNEFNKFNLSCDMMEPFRILVDRRAVALCGKEFTPDVKHELVDLLNDRVSFCGNSVTVSDAIAAYSRRVFRALDEDDLSQLAFYEFGV